MLQAEKSQQHQGLGHVPHEERLRELEAEKAQERSYKAHK